MLFICQEANKNDKFLNYLKSDEKDSIFSKVDSNDLLVDENDTDVENHIFRFFKARVDSTNTSFEKSESFWPSLLTEIWLRLVKKTLLTNYFVFSRQTCSSRKQRCGLPVVLKSEMNWYVNPQELWSIRGEEVKNYIPSLTSIVKYQIDNFSTDLLRPLYNNNIIRVQKQTVHIKRGGTEES